MEQRVDGKFFEGFIDGEEFVVGAVTAYSPIASRFHAEGAFMDWTHRSRGTFLARRGARDAGRLGASRFRASPGWGGKILLRRMGSHPRALGRGYGLIKRQFKRCS
jgi:hypothetical protein